MEEREKGFGTKERWRRDLHWMKEIDRERWTERLGDDVGKYFFKIKKDMEK